MPQTFDRVAIIDMGTNTFHLVIADFNDNRYSVLFHTKCAVKMGKGGINQRVITEEGLQRALRTLIDFKHRCDELSTKKILAFGTSALRNASNCAEVTAKIKAATGIEPIVISGEQEAELIYYGVRSAVDLKEEKSLIVDIGGGSVEFIIANKDKIFWKESLEIGAQRLLERFHRHDPILPKEIGDLNEYLKENLHPVFNALSRHSPKTLVGSSGTFDTLSDIFCIKRNIPASEDPETPLSLEGFHEIYKDLISKSREERINIPGMIEMRVDMIVTACCLVRCLLQHFPFEAIRVSSYSLKEGALAQYKKLFVSILS